tara:strand:- start:7041 stop:7385 length:345 start_codon:yes stop_codon:yes gene_type:complete
MTIDIKKDLKANILYFLKYGQEHAIKQAILASRCGVKPRALRLAIRELVDEGHPICGSPRPPYGYFIANSPEEINAELKLLKGYGKELFRRYSTLKKIKASIVLRHPGQLSLRL